MSGRPLLLFFEALTNEQVVVENIMPLELVGVLPDPFLQRIRDVMHALSCPNNH